MVTASHNPPADNGYKVYLGDGAQIVPPHDVAIAARIDAVDPTTVALAAARRPAHRRALDDAFVDALPRHVRTACACARRATGVPVAYTPMHGVGGEIALRGVRGRPGCPSRSSWPRSRPSPTRPFPTVSFPNPEEPGAMDLLHRPRAAPRRAARPRQRPRRRSPGRGDPAARRVAGGGSAATRSAGCSADHILRHTVGRRPPRGHDARVVVAAGRRWRPTTACTSPRRSPASSGSAARPSTTRSCGSCSATSRRSATSSRRSRWTRTASPPPWCWPRSPRVAAAEGVTTLQDRLDDLAARFGRHVVADLSIRMRPADGRGERCAPLRADPPTERRSTCAVTDVESYPEADLLRLSLEGDIRLQVRPSGTEPKVKLYGEASTPTRPLPRRPRRPRSARLSERSVVPARSGRSR